MDQWIVWFLKDLCCDLHFHLLFVSDTKTFSKKISNAPQPIANVKVIFTPGVRHSSYTCALICANWRSPKVQTPLDWT